MLDPTLLESWNVSALDYPANSPQRDRLAFLVRYAILAPSSHNTQPWLFEVSDDAIALRADYSRTLRVIDREGRQLAMSCAAALYNLRLAMRHFGHTDEVEMLPEPDDLSLIARVRPGVARAPDAETEKLFEAIPHRHTNRQPFEIRPVSEALSDALTAAAEAEGAWLARLDPNSKSEAAALIAAADRIQFQSKDFRRELSEWLSPGRSHRRDGIPTELKSDQPLGAEPLVVRTFDLGKSVAAKEHELASGSPMLAVLGSEGDRLPDWLRVGQAMQRILLLARVHGLSASFLNQVLEVEELRPKLRVPGKQGFPQLILRLGFGPEAPATPRRTLDEVLRLS
ncbi:Acg family FMN-binding oxidoreductase [Haliangium sp.]|uniref:Acg family FMN-binding oxidoreductase n=1 Tax=Haliangium sp. TaxID=2663208 RepID=UPI003D0E0B43